MSRWNISLVAGAALLAAAPFAARYASAPAPAPDKPAAAVSQSPPKRATAAAPRAGKPDTDCPTEACVTAQAQAELQKNICGFLKEYAGASGKGPPEPYCLHGPGGRSDTIAAGHAKVVLGILPDPVHTHLGLRFDRAIDSVQGALQRVGWTFDHSWLPWENRSYASPERFNDRLLDESLRRARDATPGVLLFRRTRPNDPGPPLVLLLVGDRPTSGVNPQQFRNAVGIWKTFAPYNTPADPARDRDTPNIYPYCGAETHLAILGPTFSGSGQSLKHLLDQELKSLYTRRRVRVSISSGTVSADDQLDSLETAVDQCGDGLHVEPKSFNIDFRYSTRHLVDYLLTRNPSGNIMELVEAESTFGSIAEYNDPGPQIKDDTRQLARYHCEPNSTRDECTGLEDDIRRLNNVAKYLTQRSATDQGDDRVRILHFPREISRLRKAYEQNGIVNFTSSSSGPRTELSFSFGTDTRDDDTVPLFSGSQADVAMETQMAQIASLLQGDHISTVILSATDVLDEIFVARYLAQHTPDLTVIIQDSDLLFLRQGSDSVMNEIYVATPWPLIEKNQRWSSPFGQEQQLSIVHPSLSDEGIYNAAQYLLCDPDFTNRSDPAILGTPCGPDIRKGHTNGITLDEYQPPIQMPPSSSLDLKEEPPLWLSVIEHGQFDPVSLIDVDNEAHQLPESSPFNLPRLFEAEAGADGKSTRPRGVAEWTSLSSKMVATGIMLLLVLHGAACMLSRLHRPFAWSYALADKEQHRVRILLQAVLPLLAIPALSLLLIPPMPYFSVQSPGFEIYLKLIQAVAVIVACIGPAMYLLTSSELAAWLEHLRRGSRPPRLPLPILLRMAACLLALVAGLVLVYECHHHLWSAVAPGVRTPAEHVFFLYRSASLLCGSSPALTLLLLLAAIAVWFQRLFSRLVFFGNRIPQVPNGCTDLRCPDQHWLQPLTDLLSGRNRVTSLFVLAVSVLLVVLMLLQATPGSSEPIGSLRSALDWITEPRGPRSLAHSHFDTMVGWLTAIVATLVVHDLFMAFTIWTRLSELCLIPLKQSPLRWGFTWIKGFSWRRILTSTQNLTPEQTFDYLMRLVQANERPEGDPMATARFNALRVRYYQSPKNLAWVNDVSSAIGDLHCAIAHAGETRLKKLRVLWASDIGPVTGAGTGVADEPDRGLHLLQPLKEVKDDHREDFLKRMASEEFVALIYLSYIRMVLVQIRNRILTAACLYVLLLWSLTSYPWMNRHAILLALSALLALISVVSFHIYSQMHRDHILSRTTETEPGKLDGGFVERLLPVVGIPLLTLIASQFPEVSNFVFSWLEPSLSKMH